jgi:dephospho-CoA kinase
MIVVGLTGSIGMGKSTVATMLRMLGLPVHDADAAVHRLLGPSGRAVKAVAKLFPEVLSGDRIDRKKLGDRVFQDTLALRRLEAILHPLVRQSSRAFLAAAARRREPLAILDIPLLYEGGGERVVDAVIVVTAPAAVQRQRVCARRGMTKEKFQAILARQTPDREKRRRATYIIRNGGHRAQTFRQLRAILRSIRARKAAGWRGNHWPPRPLPRYHR